MVRKWLITGGCGFIGRNLIRNLLMNGGHYIRIVDNLTVGTLSDLNDVADYVQTDSNSLSFPVREDVHLEVVVGDILDEQLAVKVSEGMDVVVHLAANTGVGPSVEDPRHDCVTNVMGTLNYLEASRLGGVDKFIFASSGAPAGECEPPIHEELPPHPVSPYGASKLAGEGYCSAYFRTFGVKTVALRFSNVYGPLSTKKDSVVAKFIKHAMVGRDLMVYGDGSQTRDFIYIDDLINAVRCSADHENVGGETFQIATARETTVGEIAEKIIELFRQEGKDVKIKYFDPRLGDVKRNFSDTSKAGDILHWTPMVGLEEGLQKTMQWFLALNG